MWSNPLKFGVVTLILLFGLPQWLLAQNHLQDIQELIKSKRYNKALLYSDSILSLNPDPLQKPRIYVYRADAYYYLNQLENSLKEYFAALQITENAEISYASLEVEIYSHIGFCYRELGLFDNALPHYLKSKELALGLGDSVEIATQNYNLATIYFKLSDLDMAAERLTEAYEMDLTRKDTSALGFDLSMMSNLQERVGNLDQALSYMKESLVWLRDLGSNANSKGTRLSRIGNLYLKKGQIDSASYYFDLARQEFETIGDTIHLATLWNDLAEAEIQKGNFSAAVKLSRKSKDFHGKSGYNSRVSDANITLAGALVKNYNLEAAEEVLKENIEIASDLGLLEDLRMTYQMQSDLYDKLGRFRDSKLALENYHILQDSILSITEKERIKKLELTFKFDKIEHENELLKLNNELAMAQIEKDQQRIQWLIVSLIITIVGATVIIFLLYSRYRLKKQLLTAEINELRAQIKILLEGDATELGLDVGLLNTKLQEPLTDREFEILEYAIGDLNNTEIADKVFVSVNTVKYHLKNIYHKLGVSNRKEALEYVIKTK